MLYHFQDSKSRYIGKCKTTKAEILAVLCVNIDGQLVTILAVR